MVKMEYGFSICFDSYRKILVKTPALNGIIKIISF